MKLTLHVWRQNNAADGGRFQKFTRDNVSPDSSFLEMLDGLNEELIESGQEPIAFDHDCREGFVDHVAWSLMALPMGTES